MPYTPPTHRSPASSAPASPDVSRRSSLQTGPRPSVPRSASYLTKQRRTQSAVATAAGQGNGSANNNQPTPPGTADDISRLVANSGSIRQSPPPVRDDRGMPTGAVISPPASSLSSSDDDEMPDERGRQIVNLKELQEAISQMSQHREASPNRKDAGSEVVSPAEVETVVRKKAGRMHPSFSTGSLEQLANGLRRVPSHKRSDTEPSILIPKSTETSSTGSEEDSEGEARRKPIMVRKKSGELVRPALRGSSQRRGSSVPDTPTYSKAVHFDSHLEHVRHFLQVDRPAAVSAGSSPVDTYESDAEYPFSGDERMSGVRSPPYEWEITTTNFPSTDSPIRKTLPARLEKVWLSPDQKSLMGSIAVANLAFQKLVTCRFTLDYWKTTSEVTAAYTREILPRQSPQGHDRFTFTIKLSDVTNLESKTLYLCVRYLVNGQEYWDNNQGTNFQVDFRKKHLPQNGKNGFQGLQGAAARQGSTNGNGTVSLPRSNRRANPSTAPRPRSMPVALDDFGSDGRLNFGQPIHELVGESGPTQLRLKGVKSTTSLPSDNLAGRLAPPSGQAFANRYDFGASLTAAVQAAKDAMSRPREGLYMKPHTRKPTGPYIKPSMPKATSDPTPQATQAQSNQTNGTAAERASSLPSHSPVPGTSSPSSAAIASSSYDELVTKYCFFNSKQSSPQIKDGTLPNGRFDGGDDGSLTRDTNSTESSSAGSPLVFEKQPASQRQTAEHHSLYPGHNVVNPYFQHVHLMASARGASPAGSPIRNLPTPGAERPLSPGRMSTAGPVRSASPASMVGNMPQFTGDDAVPRTKDANKRQDDRYIYRRHA